MAEHGASPHNDFPPCLGENTSNGQDCPAESFCYLHPWDLIMALIYKIIAAAAWRRAKLAGVFTGTAIDHADGYIHLSNSAQVEDTARRHFAGQNDLLLVAFEESALAALTWEPSRGGELFPHAYSTIDPKAALWEKPLPCRDGVFVFPDGWDG
jgi:uncharacterized protein (DUF952 family)